MRNGISENKYCYSKGVVESFEDKSFQAISKPDDVCSKPENLSSYLQGSMDYQLERSAESRAQLLALQAGVHAESEREALRGRVLRGPVYPSDPLNIFNFQSWYLSMQIGFSSVRALENSASMFSDFAKSSQDVMNRMLEAAYRSVKEYKIK